MKFRKILALATCIALGAAVLTSCGGANSSTGTTTAAGNDSATRSYAFLPNTQNNTFQSAMNDTFKKLCEEKGYKYTCLDPDYDLNKQLSQMSDAANQKFDAVFVIPVDSEGIRQGLETFKNANIPVFNVDTAVCDADRELVKTLVATDCVMAGELVGKEMLSKYPNGANIAILDFPSNQSCLDRVEGFLKGLGTSKDKFKIVAQQDGKAATKDSMDKATDIIQANPDIDAFFCINDPSALGAAAAIKSANKTGKIGVYSIDASPEGKKALIDGDFTAVAAQVPIKIAEKGFELAGQYLDGNTNLEKQYYIASQLITLDMAKETKDSWQ